MLLAVAGPVLLAGAAPAVAQQAETGELPGPPGAPQIGADELAAELSNPVSSLASLANNFEYISFQGNLANADDQSVFRYIFQPVLPFPRADGKNLIVRPGFPFLFGQPYFDAGKGRFDTKSGLGDISLDVMVGGTTPKGVLTGWGVTTVFPTATSDGLGKDQWQLGPEVVYGVISPKRVLGAFFQQFWDVAGGGPGTNLSSVQLFYFFSLGNGWQVGGSLIITYDWTADSGNEWTVPIALGVTRTTKAGDTPLKWALQAQYALESPASFGTDWGIKLTITPVIQNPFLK
jgi:hypothetical protein